MVRIGTLILLLFIFQQTPSHYADLLRGYECASTNESQLACYESLARNILGVLIGVGTAVLLIIATVNPLLCCGSPSVRRDVWWLWLGFRVFTGSIGVNLLMCPAIAFGDAPFRQSAGGLSFIFVAGPLFCAAGLWATHERRDRFDAWLEQVSGREIWRLEQSNVPLGAAAGLGAAVVVSRRSLSTR